MFNEHFKHLIDKSFILFIVLILLQEFASAQCPFSPAVNGNNTLCQGTVGILQTENYDTYQWYKRYSFQAMPSVIIGENSNMLMITENQTFYSVEVSLNGCSTRSSEFYVDGVSFLLPVVEALGSYRVENDTYYFCEGDSFQFYLLPPYAVNVLWYKNNIVYSTANPYCTVRQPGIFRATAMPYQCPTPFYEQSSLSLNVQQEACITSVFNTQNLLHKISIYPNPLSESSIVFLPKSLNFDNKISLKAFNALGSQIFCHSVLESTNSILLHKKQFIHPGLYYIILFENNTPLAKALIQIL